MRKVRRFYFVLITVYLTNCICFSQEYAPIPYSTNFNLGIDNYWTIFKNTSNGVIKTDSCIYWDNWSSGETSFGALLHIKKSTSRQVEISFNFSNNGELSSWGGSAPKDNFYISTDIGKSFSKVFSIYPVKDEQRAVTLNLKYWIEHLGIPENDSIIIKFERKTAVSSGYLIIDDVVISESELTPLFTEVAFPSS